MTFQKFLKNKHKHECAEREKKVHKSFSMSYCLHGELNFSYTNQSLWHVTWIYLLWGFLFSGVLIYSKFSQFKRTNKWKPCGKRRGVQSFEYPWLNWFQTQKAEPVTQTGLDHFKEIQWTAIFCLINIVQGYFCKDLNWN